jgi:hypothetical protein
MIACAAPADDAGERGMRRGAARPRLPCLKADNCIRTSRRKQLFVARENMRLYIEKFGENNIGVLTITTPGECLSAVEFQRKWHSFRTNALRCLFPTGMWIRERQPRTGNWHLHAIVDLGRDIRTGFPFEDISHRRYANVDSALRKTWKDLRNTVEKYGFGRSELLPIKRTGPECAAYLTKYLGKALLSEKGIGEENCRLFGVWGGVRFVHGQFDWVSNRILRRRKQWLAVTHDLTGMEGFQNLYGRRWWFVIGEPLMKVILPVKCYQVFLNGEYVWDEIGWFAYQEDLGRYPDLNSNEARRRQSLLDFYDTEGKAWGMTSAQAANYAMGRIVYLKRKGRELDSQGYLFPND